jgi:hypothetical protein
VIWGKVTSLNLSKMTIMADLIRFSGLQMKMPAVKDLGQLSN